MNPLKQHYDSNLTQIDLHGVTFNVRLPTLDNKRFHRAVMSSVARRNSDGEFTADDITIEQMAEAQVNAFVKHCIRSVDGWDDYNPDSFLSETPEAADDLFQLAADLTEKAEEEIAESVGKSQAGLSGVSDGMADETSTSNLKSSAG